MSITSYSPNEDVNKTIHALLELGCPPIPVAPKQNPRDKWCHRIGKTPDGFQYCPLDKERNPIPKFTGKNPSFLERDGSPRICTHGDYQHKLPTDQELRKFFCHSDTGVGTLGGHAGINWIDLDSKCYETAEARDADARAIIDRGLGKTWIERTGSGGWRIAVKLRQKATFTNFATDSSGLHRGEALYEGRYTVLAPSIHPNGKAYERTNWGAPVEVESLEAIGIFPAIEEIQQRERKQAQEIKRQENPSYGLPSDPIDNCWDIRNFANYFEGYTERGDWGYAQCPHHPGASSFTSFRVNLSTGQTKLWCNCDPKDVYRSGLLLAKSRGYQLPENFHSRQKSAARQSWLSRFRHHLSRTARPMGWGVDVKEEVAPSEIVPPKILAAIYGNETGERLNTWSETLEQSKYILDTSATGTGKSFDAGMVTPELFGARQVIYVSSEHRNPTTPTLKSWEDLEARHKGLTRDEFSKLRRAKPGQPYHISPNCGRNDTISALRSKNIGGADTSGLICKACPNLEPCQGGAVYGYLYDRAKSLKQPRLRAHPQSLPDPSEYDYSDVVLFWDEASEILKNHRSITIKASDVTQAIADLAIASPELFDALRPVLTGLYPYLSGEMKPPYYGWKDGFIRTALPIVDVDIDQLRSHLEVNFDKLLNSTKEEHGVDLADLPRAMRKRFAGSDAHLSEEISKNVSLNWLPDFITALGSANSNLTIGNNGILTITLPDQRLADIMSAAKGNIFLDATLTAIDLAPALGIEPKEILTISQAIPSCDNLEIIQIATLGRLGVGNDRTEFCQGRVDALINRLSANTSGKVAVFDFKRHTQVEDGKRHWWTGSRGINDVEDCKAAILVGVPCRNLGELEAEFKVLYGRAPEQGTKKVKYPVQIIGQPSPDLQPFFEMNVSVDDEFNEFCRRRVLADIHQAIGRLRAHRRPGEQLQVSFIADYPLDIPVTLRRAADITPEAASKVERVEMAIKGAVQQLKDAGQKITQAAIAQIVGVTQGYISRFRELLQTLLDPSYSKSNNFSDPPKDVGEVQWMGCEYLPIIAESPPNELLEEVLSTFESYGSAVWRQIWDATPAAAQIKILQALMFTLSAGELRGLFSATEVKT